jgi:hypothetical protein
MQLYNSDLIQCIADELEESWGDKYGDEPEKDGPPSSDGGGSNGSGEGEGSNAPLEPDQPF